MAVAILPLGARHLQKITPPRNLSAWELKNVLFGDLSINGCGHPPSGGKTSSKNDPSKEFLALGSSKMSLFGDLSINGCGHPPPGGKTSSKNDPSKEFKRLGIIPIYAYI